MTNTGFEKYSREVIAENLMKVVEAKGMDIERFDVTIYDPACVGIYYFTSEGRRYFEYNAFAEFSYFGGDYTEEIEGWLYSPLAQMSRDAAKGLDIVKP